MKKTYVLGDVHGGYKALKQVLERSEFDYENDLLITLGDIADGWPDVKECVSELLKIKNRIDIRGNHDQWLETWMEYGTKSEHWLSQGGQASYDSYIQLRMHDPKEFGRHHDFFRKQHWYYIDDKNRLFVHGGFTHVRGVKDQHSKMELLWDRSLWELALMAKKQYYKFGSHFQHFPKRLGLYEEIFIGHTTVTAIGKDTPQNATTVWNMDTGGGWEGKLSIMNVDTKEFFQSDLVEELYPDYEGHTYSKDAKERKKDRNTLLKAIYSEGE